MADVTDLTTPEETDEEEEQEQETEEEPQQEKPTEGVSSRAATPKTGHTTKKDKNINNTINTFTYNKDVEVESRNKVNLIFIILISVAIIGCIIVFLMVSSLKSEFRRYKKTLISKERRN
jgi:hypothetical protein